MRLSYTLFTKYVKTGESLTFLLQDIQMHPTFVEYNLRFSCTLKTMLPCCILLGP